MSLEIAFSGSLAWIAGLIAGRITREYLEREAAALRAELEGRSGSRLEAAVAHGIQMLHAGKKDTFFYLLDLPRTALPLLLRELDRPANRAIASEILEALWQSRDPSVVDRLGRALRDSDPRVWKEALNGLVAIADPASLRCLRESRDLIATGGPLPNGLDLAWIDEAIEQASARKEGTDPAVS